MSVGARYVVQRLRVKGWWAYGGGARSGCAGYAPDNRNRTCSCLSGGDGCAGDGSCATGYDLIN